VKHVTREASRNFCGGIREFAESIGKENFWLLGEVAGGDEMRKDYLEVFGIGLSAVLDIGFPSNDLVAVTKGEADPKLYFSHYDNVNTLGSHREAGRYAVAILDDHDEISRANGKKRFAYWGDRVLNKDQLLARAVQVANATAFQVLTLGIGCIYYGTEQAFDGGKYGGEIEKDSDAFLRETMFGGEFGAHQTSGKHCFDQNHPTYLRIAAVNNLRNRRAVNGSFVQSTLRRGRQYWREMCLNGQTKFEKVSQPGSIVAWSRMGFYTEVLIAVNMHLWEGRSAKVIVDSSLHPEGSALKVLYDSRWDDAILKDLIQGKDISDDRSFVVKWLRDDANSVKAHIDLDLLPYQFLIMVKA
jgi:hypothetical protein